MEMVYNWIKDYYGSEKEPPEPDFVRGNSSKAERRQGWSVYGSPRDLKITPAKPGYSTSEPGPTGKAGWVEE
jgi:hypothetical protein